MRPKGELGFVLLSRMSQCGRWTLSGHAAPTTFLTWGADVGGQGKVETTSLRRERKADLWLSRRWQTKTLHGILCTTPPSHPIPKRFPEILANSLRNSLPCCGSCPHYFSPHGLLQKPLNWHHFL